MNIRYQEYNPCAALQPYVDSYWFMHFDGEGTDTAPEQRCLPLGMMELIFHLDEHQYHATIEGKNYLLHRNLIAGMYDVPVCWRTSPGARIFGIRIKPECMMELFRIPASILFNEFADLETFFGSSIRDLISKIHEAPNVGGRIRIAEAFLLDHLHNRQHERNYVLEATKLIRNAKGLISIDDLSDQIFISTRQLQRSFKDSMGTSPKTYMRIIRFRNAYHHVKQTPDDLNWARVSYHFGYSDQAHFIRDFKQFTGAAPTLVAHEKRAFYQLTTPAA